MDPCVGVVAAPAPLGRGGWGLEGDVDVPIPANPPPPLIDKWQPQLENIPVNGAGHVYRASQKKLSFRIYQQDISKHLERWCQRGEG